MPIYEYECRTCQRHFEVFQLSAEDDHNVRCPQCHGEDIQKLRSPVSLGSASSGGCKPSGST